MKKVLVEILSNVYDIKLGEFAITTLFVYLGFSGTMALYRKLTNKKSSKEELAEMEEFYEALAEMERLLVKYETEENERLSQEMTPMET